MSVGCRGGRAEARESMTIENLTICGRRDEGAGPRRGVAGRLWWAAGIGGTQAG